MSDSLHGKEDPFAERTDAMGATPAPLPSWHFVRLPDASVGHDLPPSSGDYSHVVGDDLLATVLDHATRAASRELEPEWLTELLDRDRVVEASPDPAALRQAFRILVDFSATRDRDQYESVVDAVSRATALGANQFHQARLHGERKRWLIDHVRLLITEELVELMPDRIAPGGNAARALKGLRERDEVLGVRVMRDWRYPADQFDARGEVHAALPDVLAEARRQGYTPWEVLYWLFAPSTSDVKAVPGRRLSPATVTEESLEQLARRAVQAQRAEPEPNVDDAVRPIALLADGDTDTFTRLSRYWLGPAPRSHATG